MYIFIRQYLNYVLLTIDGGISMQFILVVQLIMCSTWGFNFYFIKFKFHFKKFRQYWMMQRSPHLEIFAVAVNTNENHLSTALHFLSPLLNVQDKEYTYLISLKIIISQISITTKLSYNLIICGFRSQIILN